MKFPNCKGFDLTCGLVITVFLDDLVALTGTFLGEVSDPHRRRRRFDFHEFILIQLTCPFCEVGVPEIPEGTFVAINIAQIQFITPGLCCQEKYDDKKTGKPHCDKGFAIWKDEEEEDYSPPVININCPRKEERQPSVTSNRSGEDGAPADDQPAEK